MRSRDFRSSRTNRDRRSVTFERSVIAEATRLWNASDRVLKTKIAMLLPCGCVRTPLAMIPCSMHLGLTPMPEIEVCPDCKGRCETEQHVTDDIVRMLPCIECHGLGWVQ